MSHDWASKPHIRIPAESVRRNPRKPRLPPRREGERKDPRQSGRALIDQLDESVKYCRRPQKVISNENILFILRTEGSVSFQGGIFDRFSLRFSLQIDDYSAIVSTDENSLRKFRDALGKYMETSRLRSYIDEINSISKVEFNRISPELGEWLVTSERPKHVEIEILPNLGEEQYATLILKLMTFLQQQDEKVVSSRIREKTASLRAYLKPQTTRIITQGVDSVWQAREAPRIIIGKPQSIEIKEKPTPKPPDSEAKTVCILDTGIDTNQPFLRGIFLDAIDLTEENLPQDTQGHGTFVAGLAAYGELENRINPKATARIISAKVIGNNSSPYPYLESRLEEAVRRFHDSARIFNLSVMYPQYCNTSQPTDLAYTIDKLSNDYNVMFVICTGNVEDELPALVAHLPYPTYLGDVCCRVYGGAEACASITVGGMAKKESDISIAKAKEPSPFTRRGELGHRGKPDVVSWGGNIEKTPETGDIRSNNEELGVASLALSPNTLAYDIGTSYATPIVANILARLSKEYPDAGNDLLKALIIHFAYWPDQHYRLNASEDLKKALYGKGIPEFYRCAYSMSSCATYIVEDSIGYNEIAFVPIYVPNTMRNIYGEKRMRITLVYNPPIDKGVVGYTLLDLDFRLYKQYERIQRNWDRVYRHKWDNVKTDMFRWQRAGWGKEWSLMIFPTLRFKNRIADLNHGKQEYAIVVTLEDPNRKVNIYDAIINERKMKVVPLEAFVTRAHTIQTSKMMI